MLAEAAHRSVRQTEARRDLVREGERPRAAHVLLEGWACRYKQLPDGRRQILSFCLPGDLTDCGIFALDRMDHSVAAVTRLRYGEIPADDVERLMGRSPKLARAFWRNELINTAVAREWIANVGQRSAYERIAHLLCELFVRLRLVGLADGEGCDFPLTQGDLADATGLTAVHVNRTLQDLRRDGLIELHGRRLAVPDLRALQRAGHFNPNYLHFEGKDEAAA